MSEGDFRAGRFNSFVRPSSDQMRQAGAVRGPMPIAPDRAHLQFSERQAAFVPRSSGNTRFFTREQPNPAPRVSFAEQRQALGSAGRPATALAPQGGAPQSPRGANGPPSWQRFGNSREYEPPPQAQSQAPQASRGWNRFGNSRPATQPEARPETRQAPQRGPSFNAPPPQRGPSFSAPPPQRSGGGGFNAPRPSGGGSRGPSGGAQRGGGGNREGPRNR